MFGFFMFPVETRSPRRMQTLVIFCSPGPATPEGLAECIEVFGRDRPPPQRIIVLASKTFRDTTTIAVNDSKFRNRLGPATTYPDPPEVIPAFFDQHGQTDHQELDWAQIKLLGMTALVQRREVVLNASPSHHYVLPSEASHSQQFVRIANAMCHGAEIDFLAFCTLPYIFDDVRHIYCDTGAISPVAYAINAMRRDLSPATVTSFHSYKGVDEFQFRDYDRSIVLISVSRTGGLISRLREKNPLIAADSIVALISLHESREGEKIVGNLRQHPERNPTGIEHSPVFGANDCELCQEGSLRIEIVGDHFLPAMGDVIPVTLRAGDAPSWLKSFLTDVAGTQLIHANYRVDNNTRASKEVFFDLQRFLDDDRLAELPRFERRLGTFIEQDVPAGICRILHLDDPASRLLADRIVKHVLQQTSRIVTPCGLRAVNEDLQAHVKESGATLVVAGAIASGRSLLAASQVLRRIQTNGAINYLVGIARLPTDDAWKGLESDLTYEKQPRDHGLHVVERLVLPVFSPRTETVWDAETKFLKTLDDLADEQSRRQIEERLDQLERSASENQRGLVNDLFWTSSTSTVLALRRGFAFFDFELAERQIATQADVFFTLLAVLHHLRIRRDSEQSLWQSEHLHRVLSPRCFDRFNDGVIQACLLRAALPVELNYGIHERPNVQMGEVLEFIFSNANNEAGEATREFLLAIAMRRLRLSHSVVSDLHTKFAPNSDDPICRLLWNAIQRDVLTA